jgi:hypothetical protein
MITGEYGKRFKKYGDDHGSSLWIRAPADVGFQPDKFFRAV